MQQRRRSGKKLTRTFTLHDREMKALQRLAKEYGCSCSFLIGRLVMRELGEDVPILGAGGTKRRAA